MPNRLTPIARRLRRDQTSAEEALWRALRGRRLEGHKFRRQVPVAGYIADFCCMASRVTVEIDGVHHARQAARDAARTKAIEAEGFRELRFSNAEIVERLDWVATEILRMLDIAAGKTPRAPHPRLDP